MAAEPPTKTDREIATVWPRGTLELREQSIAFVPTANKVPIEWRFEEILRYVAFPRRYARSQGTP
jgi:hypothetical protein